MIGLGTDENFYLLDMIRDRLSLTERADALFNLHRKWRPRGVGFERYGMLSDIEYFRERMRMENHRFDIVELGGKLAKNDRIRRLIPIFEEGRFYLPEQLWKVNLEGRRQELVSIFLDEEFRTFPVSHHDDMLDAFSRILDVEMNTSWPRGGGARDTKRDRYVLRRRRARNYSCWAA